MPSKILLVDDVQMFLELQKMFLRFSSAHVLTAKNGQEALDVVQRESPALVCLDLHMPVLDGAECCLRLKADPLFKSIPVVMITSEGKPGERDVCLQAGCDEFLTKPLDRLCYLQTIRKFLPEIDRRDARVPCRSRVKFKAFGVTLSGSTINVSANGLYIATDYEVKMGTMLELEFVLPNGKGRTVQMKGKVAWLNGLRTSQNQALPAGVGVEFVSVGHESRIALEDFLKGVQQ